MKLAVAAALLAAVTPPPQGDYDSPLGRIRLVAGPEGLKGTLVAPSPLCHFGPGEEVLRGTLLDDSLAGQVRVCLTGRACRKKDEWSSAVLLVGPAQLSGAVHVSARGCRGPFGRKGGLTLARSGAALDLAAPALDSAGGAAPASGSAGGAALPGALPGESSGDPEGARARRARARSLLRDGGGYLREGAFEQARRSFLRSIELDPRRPEAYNGVGVTHRARNDLGEALAWYKKALSVDPDFGDAYYNMACVYALQGRAEMALRYLRIASLNGYATAEVIGEDPDLASLRELPGYRSLKGGAR